MKEIKGIINICRKAGYLIIGGENILNHTQKLYLVLLSNDAGKSLQREMNFVASERKIPIFQTENLDKLTSIPNCKAVAIKNKALSDEIIELLKGE